MHVEDPYALLGVAPDASLGAITRAYRRLVRAHHPDCAPATPDPPDVALLARLADAYATLRDPAKRADYDRTHRPPRPTRQEHRPTHAGSPGPAHGRPTQSYLRVGPVRWHPLP